MEKMLRGAARLLLLVTLHLQLTTGHAQGTAFTYQGRLNVAGNPANGLYDYRFKLYSDPLGNTQVGSTYSTNAIPVANGLFLTTLDFGPGIFTGGTNWLEVDVRTNGAGSYTVLIPLQSITPTPYAMFANTASNLSGFLPAGQISGPLPASQLSGTISLANLPTLVLTNGEGSVILAGSFAGNAGGLTNLPLAGIGLTGTFSNCPDAFAPAIPLSVGTGPFCVAVADINGDGKPDLISANNDSSTLTVLTNNGSGGFGLSATLPASYPVVVVVADMNGDGQPDLICGNADDTLQIFTNNGTGHFASAGKFPVDSWPYGIAVADVNGDGKPDLISANFYQTNTLTVLTNNGNGGFGRNATLIVGNGPNSVVALDVNGDGKPDLACANYYDGTISVFLNNGQGSFVPSATLPAGIGPSSIITADINGDGKPDLIWADGGGYLMVFTNNGAGGFGLYASPSVGIYASVGVAVADINGDGKLDLISADYWGDNLTVLTNNGHGGFGSYAILPAGSYAVSVVAADINGDGKTDLISANEGDATLSLLFNLSPAVTINGGFTGFFSGNGSGISDLNAAALTGSIPPALLISVPADSLTGTLPASVIPPTLSLTSLNVDQPNQNIGEVAANALTFGLASGEGIASKRSGVNPYDLEFFTGFANRMDILNNGNVGIGTTNPQASLDIVSSYNPQLRLVQTANDYARIRFAATNLAAWDIAVGANVMNFFVNGIGNIMTLSSNGNLYCAGTVYSKGVALTSDRNAKENFAPLDPQAVLARVAALPVTEWNYK